MGGGIAQVAAQISKKKVVLVDLNKAAVDKALAFMGAFDIVVHEVFCVILTLIIV